MSNVTIDVDNDDDDWAKLDHKPGIAHMKLKENLRNLIIQKRKSELTRKIQENQCVSEKEKEIEDNQEEDEENENDDEDDEKASDDEEEDDKNEEQDENDELDEDEVDNNEESDADDELEDEDDDENFSKQKSKKRIIVPFQDSDDECEDRTNDNDTSYVHANEKDSNSEQICLDSFSQENNIMSNERPIISQIPTTQMSQEVDDNELMNLCSGKFTTTEKEPSLNENEDLDLQTSDEENDVVVSNKDKKKKYGPIEDDDDDDDSNDNQKNAIEENSMSDEKEPSEKDDEEEDENEDEEVETYIDYDSEENEIEVRLTKNERLKKVGEFFEKEAELSESDWNSADEDEKDMDKYDIELGDEDNFDEEQLHSELEKIHMRKVLDQDIREVRKLQEIFFEDEENDGIGRQRRFKWNGLDNAFTLDSTNNVNDDNDDGSDGSGDEQEEHWRKMRYERQQLLKEKNVNIEENYTQNTKEFQLSQKKLTIMKPKDNASSPSVNDIKSPFLISNTEKILKRASFLERDSETLKKLASIMKMSNEKDEDDEIMCVKSVNSRNFVFQVVSEENKSTKCLKRKMHEKDVEDKGSRKRYRFADNNRRKKTLKY